MSLPSCTVSSTVSFNGLKGCYMKQQYHAKIFTSDLTFTTDYTVQNIEKLSQQQEARTVRLSLTREFLILSLTTTYPNFLLFDSNPHVLLFHENQGTMEERRFSHLIEATGKSRWHAYNCN